MRCLQRHPKLAGRLRKLGESLYIDARRPPRVRTIAILRICGLLRCEYRVGRQVQRHASNLHARRILAS